MPDVSGEIVFSDDTVQLLNRVCGMLVHLRGTAARTSDEMTQIIDRTLSELNELQDAIEAQMEANREA